MLRRLREIALWGFQGPAFLRIEGRKTALMLRGPPGGFGDRSNRRAQHPSGVGPFSARNWVPFQRESTSRLAYSTHHLSPSHHRLRR
jgi:hypothetical protein